MPINFLVLTLKCTKSQIFYFVFAHKNSKNYLQRFPYCPDCPIGPKLKIHVENWAEEVSVISTFCCIAKSTCESGFKFKENANESIKIDYQTSEDGLYSNFKKIRIIFPNSENIFDCLEQSEETLIEVTIKYKHKVRILCKGTKIFQNYSILPYFNYVSTLGFRKMLIIHVVRMLIKGHLLGQK
jgi:hypothetical protein